MMKTKEGSKMDIQRLIGIGGSEWIKDGYHRIYFNLDIMTEMIGLDLSFYKTGNIQSARLNGETISNSKAKGLLMSINGKFWYDVKNDKWCCKDMNVDRAREIKQAILAKLEV